MAVYVDDQENNYRYMKMCHMIADTRRELINMVDRIGVHRRHIQRPDTPYEHFDICKEKRKLAVEFGAVEVSARELVHIIKQRK
jgi:hypothetical protein